MNKSILCALFALIPFSQFFAQNANQPIVMDSALRYGILDNGLTYYIRHNDVVPERADFYIVQNVGAILEEDNQNGLAHFLEHMAFNGTKNFPDKLIINYLESVGVQFGNNINAYTSLDETVYNLKSVPTFRSGIVDTALLVLHDWSGFISLNGEEIDKERGVIREEWRTRFNANRRLWKASLPILYKNSQYAKRDVIGDTAIINNFSYDTLRAFYHKWYRPDLQAIIIVGDVNVDSVESHIKRMWTDIPKRLNPTPRPIYELEKNDKPIIAVLKDSEAKTSSIRIDYRHNPMPDRMKASLTGYVMSLAHSLINQMLSGRLDEISQKSDAPFAGAYTAYDELVKSKDAFILLAVPLEGKESASLKSLLTEAERMKRYGFTQSELDRAKSEMMSSYKKSYNERSKTKNNSYVNEYVRNYLDFEPIPGIEWEYETVQEMLPKITLEMINDIAMRYVGDDEQTILMTGPEKENVKFPTENETLAMISEIKQSNVSPYEEKELKASLIEKKPKKGKLKKEKRNEDLDVEEWTLSNGIRVVLKPTALKEDEILVYGYSEGGLSLLDNIQDLPSAKVSASIVSNNGFGDFNATDLTKMLAGKVVRLSSSIGAYTETFSGNSTVKDFETLLQLIYLTFTGIREDDDSFRSLMNQYHTSLVNASKDPNQTFSDSILVTVNNHNERTLPFGLEQLEKVDQKTALKFFSSRFNNPKDFTIYLVGNLDLKTIKPLILTYLGGIPSAKQNSESWKDNNIRKAKGHVQNKFTKDLQVKKASNYVLYSGDMSYTLKNQLMLRLIADILDIRYLESMRESEGGTYGVSVRSSLSKIPVPYASLQMRFDTDPELQEKLLSLIHQEINLFLKDGPKDADFLKVKENLRNKYIENQKENGWLLNAIISYYNDQQNIMSDYMTILDGITKEDLRNTLEILVKQNNITEVVMSAK